MSTKTFLADDRSNRLVCKAILRSHITGIKPKHFAYRIIVINQFSTSFRVVNRCRCRVITCYQFGLTAYLCVVFITVERISALLCPASINIFMALLVRIVVPQTIPLTFLNCLVLLSCISLARGYDETCIYYLPFVDNQAKALQICVEMLE